MLKKLYDSEVQSNGGLLGKDVEVLVNEEDLLEEEADWLCKLFDWLTWPLTIAMSAAFAGAGWLLRKWGLRSRFKELANELVG